VAGNEKSSFISCYPTWLSCKGLRISVLACISENRTRMKNDPSPEADRDQDPQEALLHLPLKGLLPANQTLVLNLPMRTAILLASSSEGEAQVLTQQHFTPNGMRVLFPLLRAYPRYCSYEDLIASLFSLSLSQARKLLHDSWEIAMRPVRRAISGIMNGLRALGLSVRSLRGAGYVLEALSRPQV